MRLEVLHEFTLYKYPSLLFPYHKLFKKQQNPGIPARNADDNTQGTMPKRSGNQNTAVANPRHRKFFNMPPDGASIESGQALDPINRPNYRPVPARFGQNLIPNTIINPLTSESVELNNLLVEGFATNLALSTLMMLSAMSTAAVASKLMGIGFTNDQAITAIQKVGEAKNESELSYVDDMMKDMLAQQREAEEYLSKHEMLNSLIYDVGSLRDKMRDDEKTTINDIILLLNGDRELNRKIYENIRTLHQAHEGSIDHNRAIKELTAALGGTLKVGNKVYSMPKITREFISILIDYWNDIYPKLKNVTHYESDEDYFHRMERNERYRARNLSPTYRLKDALDSHLRTKMTIPGEIT